MTELGPAKVLEGGRWGYGKVEGLPLTADISSPYGPRSPITLPDGSVLRGPHTGIDLAAPKGTPVRHAGPDGIVHESGFSITRGRYVLVAHDDGRGTKYVHLTDALQLAVGMRVRRGDIIGFVGTTGRSTGYHLHFGYIPNMKITGTANPIPLFREVIEVPSIMSPPITRLRLAVKLLTGSTKVYPMNRDDKSRARYDVRVG